MATSKPPKSPNFAVRPVANLIRLAMQRGLGGSPHERLHQDKESAPGGTFRSKLTLVPPKVGGLGGQNSVSKNLGDILLNL
ncbi:hypothetical protein BJP34_16485 [Moorena producens PAL-8-15-08-1]|uniref:Uncharacterized protein n=1 Tax=Moorena producens PAL-8-15-08-1 TaxID=1458985 RepID=A0A1D8TTN2_9CYAN|nr:hypothetical protein BJP34_16485 [Moorena producens PAL-8-15-08-1]